MLLSQKTTIKLNNAESNIIGHMCYAAYKLCGNGLPSSLAFKT